MKAVPNSDFTPEQEVLFWAIRVDHSQDERIAGILKAGVDWDYLLETAFLHGILPLLYRRLKGEMRELVPSDHFAELQILFRENSVRNIQMTQHLMKILDILNRAGIDTMPFKGPILAVQAYQDLSMRSFGDLDVLIRFTDISRAKHILLENEYTLTHPNTVTFERHFGFLDQKNIQFSFHNGILELHWTIFERLFAIPLNMKSIWDRSEPMIINDRKVITLSHEDTILLLCFHGYKHGWQNLIWLADLIHMISNYPNAQIHDIIARSEVLGLKRIVLAALFLAHQYGGIYYKCEIEEQIKADSTIQNLISDLEKNIFRSRALTLPPLFYMKSRERYMDKILYLLYYPANKVLVFIRWIIRPLFRIDNKWTNEF